uniref:Tumor necrosis factor receptor superfamily member 16 n=1 Tax=Serinus canaria TaxID=9135 RepID=A0A8C9N4W1_SERCA
MGCHIQGGDRSDRSDLPALLSLQGPGAGASQDDCVSKLFTASGECCRLCNVGEGVVQPCGVNQTVCEPCLDSVTFSDTASATEPCKPCTQCEGLQSMSAPCVETDDAVCRCAYGYFQDEASGSCRECRVCQVGFGLMFPCKDLQDTVCEECPEGTFSSEANFVDPCLPCTTCEENEVLVRECTAVADAECRGKRRAPSLGGSESPEVATREPLSTEGGASTAGDTATTVMGSSQPVVTHGTSDNLIPVYCSILAAVVVGLVAYIAFKRWNSCKQNKQGANNRPVNQTPSPEGEKLHSDSGISVDSQSLHEQQPPGQGTQGPEPPLGLKIPNPGPKLLPPPKSEEICPKFPTPLTVGTSGLGTPSSCQSEPHEGTDLGWVWGGSGINLGDGFGMDLG